MRNVAYTNRIALPGPHEGSAGSQFLLFEPMKVADVDTVAAIERTSFPTPYTANIFRTELADATSSWWVVRHVAESHQQHAGPVVAYVGYFLYGVGAHVAKIATHLRWRRRGLGEWLLLNMLLVAYEEGASFVTLEVRDSNTAARQFYRKWGFLQLRRLKGHYEDTGEDGLALAFRNLATSVVRTWLATEMQKIVIRPPDP